MKMRKFLFVFAALLLLCGCGKTQSPQKNVCTVSISCAAALDHPKLREDIAALLPEDGVLLPETEVAFEEGESAFDLLLRITQDKGIVMEFEQTPMFQTAYIKGIGGLREFDCGTMSGWCYFVNGESLNVGCSNCIAQNGDVFLWEYVCQ